MRSEIWSAGTLTLECEKNIYTRAREKRESSQDCAECSHLCLYVQNAKVGIITQE